ncbi:hypothetical protein PVL29_018713 [Vitis rotundifolia]|uniref:DUF4283 domain-containing protein n=1 Tax=Vitis rotundifolia TaxID=103349 RepID=A0AA39DG78_VITRO|nr:hypothetical protein PVL29_018713 [Vitis rotundifolia]
MAEKLQQMVGDFGKKINKQEARVVGKSVMEKSFVEVLKGSSWRSKNVVRVKVKREETLGILQKLGNYIVASWKPKAAGEEDLEKMRKLWATSWGLTGNLGLARMEKNRVLLEFEKLEEARRVLDLEFWNPRSGCQKEGEESEEVWVKIVGLPISMWNPTILRRVGGGGGGGEKNTKSLGELQWARILVKKRGDFLPSVLEMEIDEDVYTLSLWWELRPALKKNTEGCSEASGRKRDEVRGELVSLAGKRVEKELADATCGPLTPPTEGTGDQGSGLGWEKANRAQAWERDLNITMGPGPHKFDPSMGPKEARRMDGPASSSSHLGSKSMQKGDDDVGLEEGPLFKRWAGQLDNTKLSEGLDRDGPNLLLSQAISIGSQKKDCCGSEMESLAAQDSEEDRRQQEKCSFSTTDWALEEEAMRYGLAIYPRGNRELGSSLLTSSFFDRASEGEFYDHSGGTGEDFRPKSSMWLTVVEGSTENEAGCWDLEEVNRINDMIRGTEGDSGSLEMQVERNEKEENCEESSLAKFSQFLGFPTEGLEKEILSFLTKIRKRRERIYSKELLEKSKFERELKRLECTVNYEGGIKQKGHTQGKGSHTLVAQ